MGKKDMLTKSILQRIQEDNNLTMFMGVVQNSEVYRHILFLHRKDLFGVEGEEQMVALPFSGEYSEDKYNVVERTKVLEFLISKEVSHDSIKTLMSALGFDEESGTLDDLVDVIAYFLIVICRNNETLRSLINDPDFDFITMKRKLGRIREFLEIDKLQKPLHESIDTSKEGLDPLVEKIFTHMASKFQEKAKSAGLDLLNSLSEAIPNLRLVLALVSLPWLISILDKSEVDYEEYLDFLNTLYLYGLISNYSTLIWCEDCGLEQPYSMEVRGRIAPDALKRSVCMRCGRPASFGCLYGLNPLLTEAIMNDNGFLSIYFGWRLESEEISFLSNQYAGKYENDFLVANTLIECKVLRRNKDSNALREEISKALRQIEKHIKGLTKTDIAKTVLLWNIDVDVSSILEGLYHKHSQLFDTYVFQVVGPSEIERLISQLKRGS